MILTCELPFLTDWEFFICANNKQIVYLGFASIYLCISIVDNKTKGLI